MTKKVTVNIKMETFAKRPNYGNDLAVPTTVEEFTIDTMPETELGFFMESVEEVYLGERFDVTYLTNGLRCMAPGLFNIKVVTYTCAESDAFVMVPVKSAEIIQLSDYRR